ncbi:tripartite tricarboxylate transporter TctB family protein [Paracoccus onubensis]|uniref:tripartite tricarboxylate transporter TctB family protein n=1 Tax=Paracoccus onubensis TaxID=1675788 RepID=UPI00272F6E3D|nr:tripartite tricarboxylate transporter TctB family protein [Paracoccus onubensis]MDP0927136.1 tripartite tricarboxylate transporter TctB family protein [Paracoccus onubensis]
MAKSRTKGLVVGATMLLTGLIYFLLAARIPGSGGVDASFFPHMLSIGMILLGAIHLFQSWRQPIAAMPQEMSGDIIEQARGAAEDEDAPAGEMAPDYLSVVLSLLLIGFFVLLMRPIGFIFAASIYLFLQIALLSPSGKPIPWLRLALMAVVVSATIFFLFRYGFSLMLPAGPLTPFLS